MHNAGKLKHDTTLGHYDNFKYILLFLTGFLFLLQFLLLLWLRLLLIAVAKVLRGSNVDDNRSDDEETDEKIKSK